ncbi:MAG TPA: DUF4743 domain-containing protein, partial [Usitatibacteraceae bacterium]|nr:DUF4743 domain-containing protein [Usitatibacteraceae bacterium]
MTQALAEFIERACQYDPADSLLPFTVDGVLAGWLTHAMAERLDSWPEYFSVRPRAVGMLSHFES